MLSLAKAAKDYYLQKLGEISPREDYYLRGGLATGVWRGSGAEELGLEGPVSAEGLVRLFDGQHPDSGAQLGRKLRKDGVAAWDLTFSADKSVSLLWALGDEDTRQRVLEAFEEATGSALSYLESVASSTRGARRVPLIDQQGWPVVGEDGTARCRTETWPIATTGYVAVSFTEFTSRADDPQLHTHVVVGNRVKGVDGIWRTLDGRQLYRHKLAAGYLHEAELRRELTRRLGVGWQPVRNGMADIEGFTRHQIEAFSRRRQQLEEWRQEQGLADTAAAREVAVLATRSPKRDRPLADLEVEWRLRAAEVGLTPERIARMMGRSRQVTPADPGALAERLASSQGLTEKASTFGRAEVVQEIAAALPGGGSRSEIEALADGFLARGEIVPVLQVSEPAQATGALDLTDDDLATPPRPLRQRSGGLFPGSPERRFTTAELLDTEQRVLRQALEGRGAGRWRPPRRLLERVLGRHPQLTASQREMVRRFATSGNAIEVGIGPAGSGKTAVMAVLAELATFTANPIRGAALAARAAVGLQTASGVPSSTLTRLLAEAREGGGLPRGVVMVVDEASMVGTRQLAAVSDLVDDAEGKLILIGDDRQLPEIDAGGMFRALAQRLPAVELTENIRQRQPWEREALTQLRDGSVGRALEMYRQRRRIIVGQCRHETLARAVEDWYRQVAATGDLTDALLIAHDNNTVTELNQRARAYFAASRRLHGPALEVGERSFQAGDRVLCLQNQSRLGVLNGDLGTLLAVDPDRRSLSVRLDRDPETRDLPSRYLEQGYVDYGYALTGHKAQGITTGRTFTIIGGTADREWTYVALSRGRQANTLYLDLPQPDQEPCTHLTHPQPKPGLDDLSASLGRSASQTAAIDHLAEARSSVTAGIDPPGPPPPNMDDLERMVSIVARRRAERRQLEHEQPGIELGIGR